jgi:crotonobetainyl-CoA:carnitine CoA-transferase CaiB-like acyl-CoA transferase
MLSGIRVLEVAQFYPAPFCCQILAEHGAEVIKIESEMGDAMRYNSALFSTMNRNKKSITLNLKRKEDYDKFMRLVKSSDIIVEGFRPGVAKKLGIDYDSLREVNKSIIYCSISGFGQESELRDIPAHDINILSMVGICSITGLKFNKPADPNVQLADFSSALYAVVSILMALIKREKTGEGEYIDLSMFDSAISSVPLHSAEYLNRSQYLSDFVSNPGYEIYKTKDGYISLGMLDEPHFWSNLCRTIGMEEFSNISYEQRLSMYNELKKIISDWVEKHSNEEIFRIFRENNIPFGVVSDIKTASKMSERKGIVCNAYFDRKYRVIGFPAVYRNYKPIRDGKVPKKGENNSMLNEV